MNELELEMREILYVNLVYKSYKGTVGKVAKNRLNRHFSTPLRPSKSNDRRHRI